MPTRSIKLKVYLPNNADDLALREDFFTTHKVMNDAAKFFEALLLTFRGTAYIVPDRSNPGEVKEISERSVIKRLVALARHSQRQNGKEGVGSDEEIIRLFQELYRHIIQPKEAENESSKKGKKGKKKKKDKGAKKPKADAKSANRFLGLLFDPNSNALLNVLDRLVDDPPWKDGCEIEEAKKAEAKKNRAKEVEKDAEETQQVEIDGSWRATAWQWAEALDDAKHPLFHPKNCYPTWLRLYRNERNWDREATAWAPAFLAKLKQDRALVADDGEASLAKKLRDDFGVLPLAVNPPIAHRLTSARSCLSAWDRGAWRLAVSHTLSWESWNVRSAAEHATLKQYVEDYWNRHLASREADVEALRHYERDRHVRLKEISEASDDNPFTISRSMTRGWDALRDKWCKVKNPTENHLMEVSAELQKDLRGKFGDPDLFRWLAKPANHHIWDKSTDVVYYLAVYNGLREKLANKKDRARYTAPSAHSHPRYTMYEPPSGSNLRKFWFDPEKTAPFQLSLPLLRSTERGVLTESRNELSMLDSKQFSSLRLRQEGKKFWVDYFAGEERLTARFKSAELTFSREHFRHRPLGCLAEGDVGSVYLKFALEVQHQPPEGCSDWVVKRHKDYFLSSPSSIHHFRTALDKKSKHEKDLEPGLRVMIPDLGMRSMASCAVFLLVSRRPRSGVYFDISVNAGKRLYAKHECSYFLDLPGDKPSARALAQRKRADRELSDFRYAIKRIKAVTRLSVVEDPEARRQGIEKLIPGTDELRERDDALTPLSLIEGLDYDASKKKWRQKLQKAKKKWLDHFGVVLGKWRRRTRPRQSRPYKGEKSLWHIRYLEEVRKVLMSWTHLLRKQGAARSADYKRAGRFANNLLEHINNMKDDRLKTSADMIVQAARGFVYSKGRWRRRHGPCRLILFEDLTRYRFRSDRSKWENSQLMRWSHRGLVHLVEMQAEIYGIHAGDDYTVGAGFSSRFHGVTGAPGVRCRVLTENDLQQEWCQRRLKKLRIEKEVTAGSLVPWPGGEVFVSLSKNGDLVKIDADINAAHQLQRRWWKRYRDAYRVVGTSRAKNPNEYISQTTSARVRGALLQTYGKRHIIFHPAPGQEGYDPIPLDDKAWEAETGARKPAEAETKSLDEDVIEAEAEQDEALERSGDRQTFFRDPTGYVIRPDQWYTQKAFWVRVQSRILKKLRAQDFLAQPMAHAV